MTVFIAAQISGLIGYFLYILSPHFKAQTTILQIGIISYVFLSLQWYLLDQPALLASNMLGIIIAMTAMKTKTSKTFENKANILYPLSLLILFSVTEGTTIDALCGLAILLSIRSQLSKTLKNFRLYAILAGILLTIAGTLAFSIPALIFNALFTVMHIKSTLRERQENTMPNPIKHVIT